MANVNNFDPAAFSVDGARHRGEMLRSFAYTATGGREGVVTSSDCRVSQLSTAGPQVQISAGAVAMRNRSAGAVAQSYVGENRAISLLDVDPTGGSARSDMVVVRVKDPQYSPWKTVVGSGSAADFQYVEPIIIQNVPSTTTRAEQLNLGYSAIALARLDIPAGTTNITTGMIKDVRSIIQPAHDPKEARNMRVWQPTSTQTLLAAHTTRQWFPGLNELIYCPAWATRCTIVLTLNSLKFQGAQCWGNIRAEYGFNSDDTTLITDSSGFHHDGGTARSTLVIAGGFAIPASFRDKAHYLRPGGVMDVNRSDDAVVTQDSFSTVIADIQFEEVAD